VSVFDSHNRKYGTQNFGRGFRMIMEYARASIVKIGQG
jgi:hypothetical protein